MSLVQCYVNGLPEGIRSPAELMAFLYGTNKPLLNMGNPFYYISAGSGKWVAQNDAACPEQSDVCRLIESHEKYGYTSTRQRTMPTENDYVAFLYPELCKLTKEELEAFADSYYLCRSSLRNFCPNTIFLGVVNYRLREIEV